MPFYIIKGTFHVTGYSPDGDSIRFKANNAAHWLKLRYPYVVLNAKEHAQLRIEAIDTLETHFEGFHQPKPFAEAALNFLLNNLGITDFEWDLSASSPTIRRANDGTPGYILTRAAEKNHRPIAFVYAGETDRRDGDDKVILDEALLKQSLNYKLLEAGLAYPTYYEGLFHDLRDVMSAAVQTARANRLGLWDVDQTTNGFELRTIADVTDRVVILPKLFRRLVSYFGNGGRVNNFRRFLDADADPILLLGKCHFTHLSTVVSVENRVIKITEPVENLVFMET